MLKVLSFRGNMKQKLWTVLKYIRRFENRKELSKDVATWLSGWSLNVVPTASRICVEKDRIIINCDN